MSHLSSYDMIDILVKEFLQTPTSAVQHSFQALVKRCRFCSDIQISWQ